MTTPSLPTERRMTTNPEEYFARGCGRCDRFDTPDCSARLWQGELSALRAVCRAVGLTETAKWGHPCYVHAGRNIALIGAFHNDVRLSFFNATLLSDPDGVLERQGPNTQHPDMMRFAGPGAVEARSHTIRAYLREAMDHAEAGRQPPKTTADVTLPEVLVDALEGDPALAEAFHALTPGRQRSYVIHLSSAKTSATRHARIERCRPKILAGKGATER